MFVNPRSAFVGKPSARRELLGQREERAVGEVVAVHEEELGIAARARRRAAARRLSSVFGIDRGNAIVRRRCERPKFIHFPSPTWPALRGCSKSGTPAIAQAEALHSRRPGLSVPTSSERCPPIGRCGRCRARRR